MPIVEKNQVMTAAEIEAAVHRLGREIFEGSAAAKNLALIGIRRRGVPLAQRIAQAIRTSNKIDVPVGTLDITLYRDDLSKIAAQPV
jgi:pyrimidine operon attenuation protein/uracil phosphoribosyltransferase